MPERSPPQESLLAAVVREVEERVDAAFGPGTYEQLGQSLPAVFLRRPVTPPTDGNWTAAHLGWKRERDRDLDIMAGRLVRWWRPHGLDDRLLRELAVRECHILEAEKLELARWGLVQAAGWLEKPRTIRLGQSPYIVERRCDEWSVDEEGNALVRRKIRNHPSKHLVQSRGKYIKDEDGYRLTVIPDSLPLGAKLTWYRATAIGEARAELRRLATLKEAKTVLQWPRDHKTGALRDDVGDERTPPPDDALEAEEATACSLPDLLEAATAQQHDIILALADTDCGPLLEGAMDRPLTAKERDLLDATCGSHADAARLLGKSADQVYVQLHRLRKKFPAFR